MTTSYTPALNSAVARPLSLPLVGRAGVGAPGKGQDLQGLAHT